MDNQSNSKQIHLYTDGSSRNTVGEAGISICVVDPQSKRLLFSKHHYIGTATCNEAEYLALIYGLEVARKFTSKEVFLISDSQLVINQVNKLFRVKKSSLEPFFLKTQHLISNYFQKVTLVHKDQAIFIPGYDLSFHKFCDGKAKQASALKENPLDPQSLLSISFTYNTEGGD